MPSSQLNCLPVFSRLRARSQSKQLPDNEKDFERRREKEMKKEKRKQDYERLKLWEKSVLGDHNMRL
ncbi:hypothetical protein EJ08DRAFT_144941 [Tothia fuscella]|uniref:Uncharacterized protein n=1 Tax=Tothia fuscella TaxID=1048955 RepID=A0A9P4U3X5_9PEZI|nr:hypothetical protein EJ08DRAFT_144941 [Tothia fuscella]